MQNPEWRSHLHAALSCGGLSEANGTEIGVALRSLEASVVIDDDDNQFLEVRSC